MLVVMPLPAGRPPGPDAYTYAEVTREIARYLAKAPRGTKKQFAAACGIDAPGFAHRMTEYRGERFTIEQLGAIAEVAAAKVPWPFVSWETAEAFDAFRKLLEKAK